MPKAKLVLRGEEFKLVQGLALEAEKRMAEKLETDVAGPEREFYVMRLGQYTAIITRCHDALCADTSQDADEDEE